MIIQCEQCRTKFKLDDSKVPDKGVKVRCAKCKYVFSVARELPETEPKADFEGMLETSVLSAQEETVFQTEYTLPEDSSAVEFGDEAPFEDAIAEDETMTGSASFAFEEEDATGQFVEDDEAFSSPSILDDVPLAPAVPETEDLFPAVEATLSEPDGDAGDVDFGSFSFNEDEADNTSEVPLSLDFGETTVVHPPVADSREDDFGGLDFSDDDMFGTVVAEAPEETEEAGGFDFGMDDFASSMGVDDKPAGQSNAFSMTDSPTDTPFSLDEIDFGDDLTSVGVQHVNPEELKPSQELLFAPLAEAQSKPLSSLSSDSSVKGPAVQEDLPPLSIASRRKQSPLFTGLVAVLGVVVAAVVAIYGYSMFAGDKGAPVQEAGKISIRNVDATFVKNKTTGDLLVISGEAVNDFSKPRASIQIKGLVYGPKGEEIASKSAYCGNPLSNEQLSTMSMDKIEAAMANQFGDSLGNMEVPPGKAIPFVIVIAKPAAEAKDYGVSPIGSTVATGKQQ